MDPGRAIKTSLGMVGTLDPVVDIADLAVEYHTEEGAIPAVRSVSLAVGRGETVGLVGESGSGKSTLALAAIGYLPANGRIVGGSARIAGEDTVTLDRRRLRRLWGAQVGLVSQNPAAALNPSLTIGRQLDEMGRRHLGLGRSGARHVTLDMLHRVQMPDPEAVTARYPHQLSGGMLQRTAIAMALITQPAFLILDEPTTALDVTTQAVVLDLLGELKKEFNSATLYITHNLCVVARNCDRVAVMYAGEVVEEGPIKDVFSHALHPYTLNLLNCVPTLGRTATSPDDPLSARSRNGTGPAGRRALATIPGSLPRLSDLPPGCAFAPRCPLVAAECIATPPRLTAASGRRSTACLRWDLLTTPEGRRAALHSEQSSAWERTIAGIDPQAGRWSRAGVGTTPRSAPLLQIDDAVKLFDGGRGRHGTRAVDGVTLRVGDMQTYGLVGESGSGKTTLARLVAGLTPAGRGRVLLEGRALEPGVASRPRPALRRLQMVFQSPEASLNPRRTVGDALERPLRLLAGLDRRTARERALALLEAVRLPATYLHRYPSELSGGEKQRVAIARAFAAGPDLVICDEPLSSLDVSVQGALMNLLVGLQEHQGASYLFISHDLAAVQHLSHFIGVMYLGKIVEQGLAEKVLGPPYHPYTEALVSAVPVPDPTVCVDRVPLKADPSVAGPLPPGCRFHPRCPRLLGEVCRVEEPPWRLDDGRVVSAGAPDADTVAADAGHAIRCHIPLEGLATAQRETALKRERSECAEGDR